MNMRRKKVHGHWMVYEDQKRWIEEESLKFDSESDFIRQIIEDFMVGRDEQKNTQS